ncbi:hypothetical protein BJY24_001458 [Nocardia transvalensis]|uniref:Uncharacterized protein n=1 Tax=Nocardia transvalensis TaxID=37333 RepID=A0A7W9PAU4_9NOCA|nr:hypothetical protein [Nocardia transvalensis]MBB5912591.1 hypothetical protein [Nocardia transvalensis]
MPGDSYDDIRHGHDSNTRGRIFENGTEKYFRDRENGYVKQPRSYSTPFGSRKFDKAKNEGRDRTDSLEDKSGRVEGKKDENQLRKDYYLLQKGIIHSHRLRTVEGEKISKKTQELIDKLSRDFPDRFTHQIISRDQAAQIYAMGQEREKDSRQLELVNAQALRRRQRAAERLPKVREAAERLREQERQQGERDERRRVEREAAERVVREFRDAWDARGREEREAGERAAREAADNAERARRQREVADARLRSRLPPDVTDLLFKGRPAPGQESPFREPPSAGSTRGGREERGRERGVERGRR